MIFYDSYQSAIRSCTDTKTVAIAQLYHAEKTMDIHIHDFYEVYYSISAGKQLLVNDHLYDFGPGDIFFMNQVESRCLSEIDQQTHERIVLLIHPEYLEYLSTAQTDLSLCFTYRTVPIAHKITLNEDERKRFTYFMHKLLENRGFGQDVLDRAVFSSLMTFLNQIFISRCAQTPNQSDRSRGPTIGTRRTQVDDILSYINSNLAEDLSTPVLAAHFYLSRSYLCELFKNSTGTTINHYVTDRRISYAKNLLADGHMVAETCNLCGFKDYSHFVKSFTKAVGVPPKKYATYTRG